MMINRQTVLHIGDDIGSQNVTGVVDISNKLSRVCDFMPPGACRGISVTCLGCVASANRMKGHLSCRDLAGILTYPLKTRFTALLYLNIISKQRHGESMLSILNTWNKHIRFKMQQHL